MAPDPRFFPTTRHLSIDELAELADADIAQRVSGKNIYTNVAPLDTAGPHDVSFLDNKMYLDQFRNTRAGCCIVNHDRVQDAPAHADVLSSQQPYLSYARVATAFHPNWDDSYNPTIGVDSIHNSSVIGNGTKIGVGTVVGPDAHIGSNCSIGTNSYIGNSVQIGNNCRIGSCVSIRFSNIGNKVSIYSGARIGEPGFGFAVSEDGLVSVPQVGRVIIGNGVAVGANTTIDRGAGPDTVIGDGTRIDNLVQIGHNVRVGRECIIVAQAGIAGSTMIGDGVQIGGQAGITGHLTVGDKAKVAGRSGIMRDVDTGVTVAGTPGIPIKQWLRQSVVLARLAKKSKR